jgi:hypothetical protein
MIVVWNFIHTCNMCKPICTCISRCCGRSSKYFRVRAWGFEMYMHEREFKVIHVHARVHFLKDLLHEKVMVSIVLDI